MSAVINPTNVVFGKGYLFGTIQGGVSDSVPFGELQSFELNMSHSLEELMGPSQLTAIGVGIKEVKVTGKASHAKIRTRQLLMAMGGTSAYSSSTTLTLGVNDEPVKFNLHFKVPSDAGDMEIILYGCVAPSMDIKVGLNQFVLPELNFNVYGDGTNILKVILPGDQTTS